MGAHDYTDVRPEEPQRVEARQKTEQSKNSDVRRVEGPHGPPVVVPERLETRFFLRLTRLNYGWVAVNRSHHVK